MESHDKDEPLETRLAQVRGQVQGVGYPGGLRTPRARARRHRLGPQPHRRFGRGNAAGLSGAAGSHVRLA